MPVLLINHTCHAVPISDLGTLISHIVLKGDWHLPDWKHLPQAAKALVKLVDKAGSPDGLLLQLNAGIKRLEGLQRLMQSLGSDPAVAVSQFEAGYMWLQVR